VPDDELSRPEASRRHKLLELAAIFLRLGSTAFGGPAAHIGLMEQEFVQRRRWLSHAQFLDLLGATNMIPGPNSTEMAIYIGRSRAGWRGLIIAGVCFIVPAMVLVGIIAWAYVRFGKLAQVQAILYGIKPVIIAIVLQALWRLGRAAVKSKLLAFMGLGAVAASFLGAHELLVLFGTGVLAMFLHGLTRASQNPAKGAALPFFAQAATGSAISGASLAAAHAAVPFSMWGLFLFFLKVGSVLFGSGYVLLAFLRADLVERWHWLTGSQLLDAVAVGQVTPGPLFTTATFIGYVLGGPTAAVLATVGIFLPAFVFTAISGPLIPRLRQWAWAGALLDGVNVASLGLMAVVTWQLATAALVDWLTWLLALVAGAIALRWQINSAWLVLGGALAGGLALLLRHG
jgi:chromate transporter